MYVSFVIITMVGKALFTILTYGVSVSFLLSSNHPIYVNINLKESFI